MQQRGSSRLQLLQVRRALSWESCQRPGSGGRGDSYFGQPKAPQLSCLLQCRDREAVGTGLLLWVVGVPSTLQPANIHVPNIRQLAAAGVGDAQLCPSQLDGRRNNGCGTHSQTSAPSNAALVCALGQSRGVHVCRVKHKLAVACCEGGEGSTGQHSGTAPSLFTVKAGVSRGVARTPPCLLEQAGRSVRVFSMPRTDTEWKVPRSRGCAAGDTNGVRVPVVLPPSPAALACPGSCPDRSTWLN